MTCLAWIGEARQAGEEIRRLQSAAEEARDAGRPFAYRPATLAAAQSWLSVVSPPVREAFATTGAPYADRPGAPRTPAPAGAAPYDMPDDAHIPAVEAMRTALRGGQGEAAVAEATRVLQRYHLSDRTLTPLVLAVLALVYAGRLDLALTWIDRLLGECSARNAPTWQAALGVVRAEVALRQGDLPGAAAQARQAMSLISAQCWGVAIALPLAILIEAETQMGNLDEAMSLLEQPVPDTMLETQVGLHYLRARGRCHLATGRYHAAVRDFLTCGELMQAWGMDAVELAPWRLDAAEAWLAIGNVSRARQYVEQQKQREPGPPGSRARGAPAARPRPYQRRPRLPRQTAHRIRRGPGTGRGPAPAGRGARGTGQRPPCRRGLQPRPDARTQGLARRQVLRGAAAVPAVHPRTGRRRGRPRPARARGGTGGRRGRGALRGRGAGGPARRARSHQP
ncbi:hypothetical protein GCM10020254_74640 [Streptomyces goshikiensis]